MCFFVEGRLSGNEKVEQLPMDCGIGDAVESEVAQNTLDTHLICWVALVVDICSVL